MARSIVHRPLTRTLSPRRRGGEGEGGMHLVHDRARRQLLHRDAAPPRFHSKSAPVPREYLQDAQDAILQLGRADH